MAHKQSDDMLANPQVIKGQLPNIIFVRGKVAVRAISLHTVKEKLHKLLHRLADNRLDCFADGVSTNDRRLFAGFIIRKRFPGSTYFTDVGVNTDDVKFRRCGRVFSLLL